MRVWIDGFVFSHSAMGGVARYVSCLVNHFSAEVIPVMGMVEDGMEAGFAVSHPNCEICRMNRFAFRPGRISYALLPWRVQWHRFLSKADVLHPSYYETWEGAVPKKKRLVVTCHDLAHERFPKELDPEGYWRRRKTEAFRRAAVIVCVSERTQVDFWEWYADYGAKTVVIPLGADALPEVPSGVERDPNNWLFVGGRSGYKEFGFALQIAREARTRWSREVRLRVVGRGWNPDEEKKIHEAGLVGAVELVESPSDEALAVLYAESSVLLYPSRWEGFGLPPLEAARLGCLTAGRPGTTVWDHLGPESGMFIEEERPEFWAGKLVEVLNDESRCQAMRLSARQAAERFRWEETARATEAVYQGLVG